MAGRSRRKGCAVADQVVETSGGKLRGGRADRRQLAHTMSETWLAFARHGDPNHAGLPYWPAYDTTTRATLLFDVPCHVEHDPHREERLA
jgi:para-nitrobenzyl esterase